MIRIMISGQRTIHYFLGMIRITIRIRIGIRIQYKITAAVGGVQSLADCLVGNPISV